MYKDKRIFLEIFNCLRVTYSLITMELSLMQLLALFNVKTFEDERESKIFDVV